MYVIPLLWLFLAWVGRTSCKQLPEPEQPGSERWQKISGHVMRGRSTCPILDLAPCRVWQRIPRAWLILWHGLTISTSTGKGSDGPLCCPIHQADLSHSAFSYFIVITWTTIPSKGLTVFVHCLLFQTPFSWPVSTAISLINNIYCKCTLY